MHFLEFFSDQTLNIVLLMCYLVVLGVFWIIYPLNKKEHLKILIIGHAMITVTLTMITFRNVATGSLDVVNSNLGIIIGNIFMLGGEYVIIIGFLKWAGCNIKYQYFIIISVLFTVTHFYFTYFEPSMGFRIINFSSFMLLAVLFFLIRSMRVFKEKIDIPFLVVWLLYFLFALNHFARLINAIAFEVIDQLFRDAIILKAYILLSIVICIVRITSILIINTKDLIE